MSDGANDDTNVIEFTGVSRADVPVQWLLEKAKGWGATDVVVIAIDDKGELSVGSSTARCERINWLIDRAKRDLFERYT